MRGGTSVARLRRLAGHKPAGTFFRGFLAGCRPEAGSKPVEKMPFQRIFWCPILLVELISFSENIAMLVSSLWCIVTSFVPKMGEGGN